MKEVKAHILNTSMGFSILFYLEIIQVSENYLILTVSKISPRFLVN